MNVDNPNQWLNLMTEKSTRPRCAFMNLGSLSGGGAERAILHLTEGLLESGWDVDIVCRKLGDDYKDLIPKGARTVDLHFAHTFVSLPSVVQYLSKTKPEIVVVSGYLATNVVLLANRLLGGNLNVIIWLQNNVTQYWSSLKPGTKQVVTYLSPRLYPEAKRFIAVSQGVADDIVNQMAIDKKSVRVIFNPIITNRIFERKTEMPDHRWYKEDIPVFVAAGRLEGQKDFPNLIHALATVQKKHKARLIILGKGSLKEELVALRDKLGLTEDIDFPGFASNSYAYFAHSAAFVLSSRFEGLPSVLLEALACGVPIVSTDCPSGPFEILNGGEYGRLVPVGDSQALADSMCAVLEGKVAAPPTESWKPYHLDILTPQFLALFAELGVGTLQKTSA
jgi:glycosyltransferase involved in cell wall biosynthesis